MCLNYSGTQKRQIRLLRINRQLQNEQGVMRSLWMVWLHTMFNHESFNSLPKYSFNGDIYIYCVITYFKKKKRKKKKWYFALLTRSSTKLKASMKRGFCVRVIVDLENLKRAKQRFGQYWKYNTCCYFVMCEGVATARSGLLSTKGGVGSLFGDVIYFLLHLNC